MFPDIFKKKIILGSASPRRKELLSDLGFTFEIIPPNIVENFDSSKLPGVIAESIALKKAESFKKLKDEEIYLTCDTLVYCDGEVLNKPEHSVEAIEMLKLLSGKTHQVYSGVCLRSLKKTVLFHEVTHVTFKKLDEELITYYIEKYRPFDKAGAYAIQEWIGYVGIEKIEGCYYNVVGLPLSKLWKALQEF